MEEPWKPAGYVADRTLQRRLLVQMQAVYPDRVENIEDVDWPNAVAQLSYLQGHGLCDAGLLPNMVGYSWQGCSITVAGLDFLAEDGGLSAILGVVTIKVHADTIREMLVAKVDASDLPAEKKSVLKTAIGKMSGAAMTAATGDLARMGLEHAPNAVHWLERLVSSFS